MGRRGWRMGCRVRRMSRGGWERCMVGRMRSEVVNEAWVVWGREEIGAGSGKRQRGGLCDGRRTPGMTGQRQSFLRVTRQCCLFLLILFFFFCPFFNLVAFSTLFPSFPSSLPIHGPLRPGQPVNGRHRSPGAPSLRPDPVLLRANLFGPFPPSNLSFFSSPFHGSDKDSVGYQVGNLL
jgi:hypothetical protein